MTFALTIAGVAKLLKAGSLRINQTANGRTTASFSIISEDRSYRPAQDAEVIITEDGTRIFAGLIDRPVERGIVKGSHPGIITTVSVVDFNAYVERRYVNASIAAGTLKAALNDVILPLLSGYGVTLHASQVNGPNLPALEYNYRPLGEVLNEFSTLTADAGEPYVWRIDNFKVLRMYQPSTAAAPFNLVGNDLPEVIGDLEVERNRDSYANRIIVKVPAKTVVNHTDTFTGDGVTYSFPLTYTLTKMNYIVTHNGVNELLTFQGIGFDLAVYWLYYSSDNTIRRLLSGTPDPPANGNSISITYDGVREATAVISEDAAEIAANGIWERVIVIEDVPSDTTTQALADAELAKRLPPTHTIRYNTFEQSIETGQSQTVTVSARNVSSTAIITDVVTRDFGKDRLVRQVTAVVDAAKTNQGRNWRDVYKLWAGDKAGSSAPTATVGSGTPTHLGPAPPERSVQFNNVGVFGGDAAFIYYADENSIVCGGGGSSITAADFESCQVFGSNNHIADP